MTSARWAGTRPAPVVPAPARRDTATRDSASFTGTSGLRARTGLTLVTGGAILLLAVHVRTPFLDLQTVGLILFVTGLAWMWIPVRGKGELLRRQRTTLRAYLERDAGQLAGDRYPLGDLLEPGAGQPAAGPDPAAESGPPFAD